MEKKIWLAITVHQLKIHREKNKMKEKKIIYPNQRERMIIIESNFYCINIFLSHHFFYNIT